jgi:hypothetical protein
VPHRASINLMQADEALHLTQHNAPTPRRLRQLRRQRRRFRVRSSAPQLIDVGATVRITAS